MRFMYAVHLLAKEKYTIRSRVLGVKSNRCNGNVLRIWFIIDLNIFIYNLESKLPKSER